MRFDEVALANWLQILGLKAIHNIDREANPALNYV
jgi:hypothetical protein